jgi:hypothetical protein
VAHEADPARDPATLDPEHEAELGAERGAALVALDVKAGNGEHAIAHVGELERRDLSEREALVEVAKPLGDALVAKATLPARTSEA